MQETHTSFYFVQCTSVNFCAWLQSIGKDEDGRGMCIAVAVDLPWLMRGFVHGFMFCRSRRSPTHLWPSLGAAGSCFHQQVDCV